MYQAAGLFIFFSSSFKSWQEAHRGLLISTVSQVLQEQMAFSPKKLHLK